MGEEIMKRSQRYETRLQKRKQNRFLNIAIGMVFILIVIVAFNLFYGEDNKTASTNTGQQAKSGSEEQEKDTDDRAIEMEAEDSQTEKTDEDPGPVSDENQEEQIAEEPTKEPAGGGPEGPWEPIGTSQKEPHQKSYDDQSQDWKEMVQALSYATNIPEDQMTIIWLGNGGSPELSKGTVQSKADGAKYEVLLQWIPEKGWKPSSVTPVSH
jgi:cytoskeletal protein RodZ